ncbi:MAG: ribose-phosphate pyrophosphokinase [Erysipelotrichaceae bacterium]|nr:ribose-phosphate pyrophosphokinase [Erysipelotrichaceae bacterium]
MKNSTVVFALTSSIDLANEIASQLGVPLGLCEVKHFADGEIMVELGESVRGKHVYIVQSTCNPVSSNLMEVLIAIDAAKRASAEHITVIMPYFGYARQDRKAKPRQPITSKLVADLLETAGANRIITMELHATQIQGFFDIPADDITAIPIIGKYFKSLQMEDVVVVSPDHGGTTRARKLAEILHAPLAIIDKRRPKPNVAEAMNLLGDVDGKIAIMVDDIVDTAGTLMSGIKMLYDHGAKEVYASCVHGVLSGPAIERLKASNVKGFVCTNTIAQDKKQIEFPEMKVLSVGEVLGKTIKAIEEKNPVSKVLKDFEE